ncbi:SusC/RagA family TonB-linked outer membrane protein [Flavivirga jejuensis]|uniref:TonB-dependent receptor n=1 Tax=Flavivirga jejuensis TaxID=870487 RepID=A0ABT8WKL4_9FLAO|nr:TonB-dependent receptor [Flavivirga jejuensis]MDO5973511.1 TonB-dependent receptor [Flavivirga jejuensis]
MRIFIFLLCTTVFSFTSVNSFSQENVSIDKDKKVSVYEVFNIIKKQTKYRFLYPESLFVNAPKVALKKGIITLSELLEQSLSGINVKYEISKDNTIVIEQKNIVVNREHNKKQQTQISGIVADQNGQPLPGANISVKGTINGVQADFDGRFSIQVTNPDAVLVISYVGFTTLELALNGQTTVAVKLKENRATLNEIVVIGYGTQKKINVTGAVATIQPNDFQNNIASNTGQLLQGISPNLNVTLSDGDINNEADIDIRGIGSINGGNPLILIDGVQGNLNRINPRDIASISVLKDAASASIYGARASFGVILITTKKAREGDVKINYTSNYGWSTPTIRTDNFITDGLEWARLSDQLSLLENTSTYLGYTNEDYAYLEARQQDPSLPSVLIKTVNGVERYVHYGNTDWWDTIFENQQPQSEHNLNLSGGTEKMKFYLSGRYLTRKGIYKINPDNLDVYTLRNRVNIKPADWVEIGNSINVFSKKYTHPATNTRFIDGTDNNEDWRKYTFHAAPLYMPTNPDGSIIIRGAYTNNRDIADGTFADLLYGKSKGVEKDFEIFNTSTVQLNILKGLKVNADYSFRWRNQSEWVRIISTPFTNQPNGEGVALYKTNTQTYKELERKTLYQAVNAYAAYNIKPIDFLDITTLIGFNQEWNSFKRNIANRNGNISENLNSFGLANGDNIFLTSTEEEWAIRAGFYRLSFDLFEKYLFEMNGRFDLSSRFPKEDRLGMFPSASAGWILSKEDFWKQLNLPINTFKLRGSYGELGNQNVGAYDYISTFSIDQSNYIVEDAQIDYLTTPQPISSNYTWERTKTLNLGVDLGAFNNRFNVTFDWFQRDVVDMLTQGTQLPSVFGATEPDENAADLRTKGFELTLAWRDQFKLGNSDFKYHASFVLGDSRTHITIFDNPNGDIEQFYVGKEVGEIWGYTVEGFFQSDDEYLSHADQTLVNERIVNNYLINHPVAGDIKFTDLNGDGVISPGDLTVEDPGDLQRIGNTNPRYNYGITLGAEYKGFDVSVFAQGIMKRDWNPGTDNGFFWGPFARQYQNFYPKSIVDNSWTPENPNAYFPRLAVYAERGGPYEGAQLGVNSNKYLQNAAYLRVKNLTVGYTIPQVLVNKLRLDKVRLYGTGMNLFTFSPIYKNNPDRTIDPEQLGNGNAYPFTKTYVFGIDINL